MSYAREYYLKVINALAATRPNQYLKHEYAQALAEDERVQKHIHALRDDIGRIMADHTRQSRSDEPSHGEAVDAGARLVDHGIDSETTDTDTAEKDTSTDMMAPLELTLSIPNGRVGEAYQQDLIEFCPELGTADTLTLEGQDKTGLDLEGSRLVGTPTSADLFALQVTGEAGGRTIVKLTLKVAVIARSRDLWKNIPADPDERWARPENDSHFETAGKGRSLAMASNRGRSHAHRGLQRDDHGVVRHIPTDEHGWNVLVTADGAGSCRFSRQGSWLAANAVVEHLEQSLTDGHGATLESEAVAWWHGEDRSRMTGELLQLLQKTIITAVHNAFKAVSSQAAEAELPYRDFSTTLLIALERPTAEGHLVIAFGVGDGAIACIEGPGKAHLMNLEDSGEHAGQTRFLDGAIFKDAQSLYQRVQVTMVPRLAGLVVATDGVTDPCFSNEIELHSPDAWWQFFETLEPYLVQSRDTMTERAAGEEPPAAPLNDYLDFFREGHHDDRTLAILFNHCDPAGEARDSGNEPVAADAAGERNEG